MNRSYSDMTLGEFLEALGSKTSSPAAGSACAVALSMAAALVEMSAGYLGDDTSVSECVDLRHRSLELAQADTDAYSSVLTARKLPRDTPEQEVARTKAIEDALQAATDVPIRIGESAVRVTELAHRVAGLGVSSVAGDALAGAELATAAARGCYQLIRQNLVGVHDQSYLESARSRAAEFVGRASR